MSPTTHLYTSYPPSPQCLAVKTRLEATGGAVVLRPLAELPRAHTQLPQATESQKGGPANG